MSGDPKIGQ